MTYGFRGFGEEPVVAPPEEFPVVPTYKNAAELTPLEFLDRLHKAAWGLSYLRRNIPRHRREFNAFAEENPDYDYASIHLKLELAQAQVEVASGLTARIFGEAWETVLAAAPSPVAADGSVDPVRSPAISAAADTAGAEVVTDWLGSVTSALKAGFDAIQAESDVRYEEAMRDLNFWGALYNMTAGLFALGADGLRDLIQKLVRFIADLGGDIAEGAENLFWKILKPLLIPAGLVVLGYVGWRYYQRRQAVPVLPPDPVSGRASFLCSSGYVNVGEFIGERCPAWRHPARVPECVRRVVRANCQRKQAGFGRVRSRRRRGLSGCGCGR